MKTYDPSTHVLSFKGINIDGFADGEFITAGRLEKTWSFAVGGQGDVARVQNRNATGQIKFVTQRTAAINAILSSIVNSDEKNGDGVGAAQLSDTNGTSIAHSAGAFLQCVPDLKVAKDLPTVEWILFCDKLDITVGGSDT